MRLDRYLLCLFHNCDTASKVFFIKPVFSHSWVKASQKIILRFDLEPIGTSLLAMMILASLSIQLTDFQPRLSSYYKSMKHSHMGFSWLTSSSFVHSFLSAQSAKLGATVANLLSSG